MRIDKWLWAARFFKTRALAQKACDLGRVESNAITAKQSREVRLGDTLHIKTEAGEFQVEVLILGEIRGPAAVAQTFYRESDSSRQARIQRAEERKTMMQMGMLPESKPSKRDRRELDHFRGRD